MQTTNASPSKVIPIFWSDEANAFMLCHQWQGEAQSYAVPDDGEELLAMLSQRLAQAQTFQRPGQGAGRSPSLAIIPDIDTLLKEINL